MNGDLFIRKIQLNEEIPPYSYLSGLPAVTNLRKMGGIEFRRPVTIFVGENGVGKSTLIEAIAVAMRFNPEGGSINFNFSTHESHSDLHKYLSVTKGVTRKRDGYFLRAESFYNVATHIVENDIHLSPSYNFTHPHEVSHGESFMLLFEERFAGNGIYILDEPEAALSPSRIMRMMVLMQDLINNNSQFIISTHSPLLMSFPNADVYQLSENAIELVDYRDTDHFKLTKQFINDPDRILKYLLG